MKAKKLCAALLSLMLVVGGLSGCGGGGGDNADEEFEDPDPGAGEGDGSDRAAVFVQVMDGETNRTIKKDVVLVIQCQLYLSL